MKRAQRGLNSLYTSPLPLAVRPLPPLIPHNPLSVLYYVWEYLFPRAPTDQIGCEGIVDPDHPQFVRVASSADMETLWRMGFFGKGTLSRSEPSWYPRAARRLELDGGDVITSEDITRARRQERRQFKLERAKAEQLELDRRRKLDESDVGNASLTSELPTTDSAETESVSTQKLAVEKVAVAAQPRRTEDEAIIGADGKLIQQEYLQLMPCEALFLVYAMGTLVVKDESGRRYSAEDLLALFAAADSGFVAEYVAYHHYRSQGWCVRSGVKFGTDLLLYRRGPPFSHAEFAVRLFRDTDQQQEWWWNTSVSRIVGGAKKTLVFCYIERTQEPSSALSPIDKALAQFRVREVVYRRWIPTRNRD